MDGLAVGTTGCIVHMAQMNLGGSRVARGEGSRDRAGSPRGRTAAAWCAREAPFNAVMGRDIWLEIYPNTATAPARTATRETTKVANVTAKEEDEPNWYAGPGRF